MTGMAVAVAVAVAASVFAASALAAGPPGGVPANEHVCGLPAGGDAQCFAIRHNGAAPAGKGNGHKPGPESPPPVSYGAFALQEAYGLSEAAASAGAGATVAIVDAYDDPNAYEDLAHYREEQGLTSIQDCPPAAIEAGSTTPCFAKVNQAGAAGPYPSGNTGWAEEISLDLDMVSAICPDCNVLLVEATSNSFEDLAAAVDRAATFNPVAIGNSYGGGEFSGEEAYAAAHYSHPGIAITAASGDNGYGAEFPAAGPNVIAVGGTSLREEGGGWTQTVWSGAGSGCSAVVAKPGWQSDTAGCTNRTISDTAAVADPNTGVQVYDTYNEPGEMVFGGTSASTQIIAAVYGLLGHGASDAGALYGGGSILFGSPNSSLTDVTSGSNGSCTGHGRFADTSLAYLCTGEVGYDGPTGMGTPAGTAGF
jgi:subtilase family serine protease